MAEILFIHDWLGIASLVALIGFLEQSMRTKQTRWRSFLPATLHFHGFLFLFVSFYFTAPGTGQKKIHEVACTRSKWPSSKVLAVASHE